MKEQSCFQSLFYMFFFWSLVCQCQVTLVTNPNLWHCEQKRVLPHLYHGCHCICKRWMTCSVGEIAECWFEYELIRTQQKRGSPHLRNRIHWVRDIWINYSVRPSQWRVRFVKYTWILEFVTFRQDVTRTKRHQNLQKSETDCMEFVMFEWLIEFVTFR